MGRFKQATPVLVFLLIMLFPLTAFPEQQLFKIKEMKLSLWSEYDDPRVLGIYRGKMDGTGTWAPGKVTFRVPKGAEVSQACSLTETDEHLCQLPQVADKGEYLEVSYDLPKPTFLLEFYFPLKAEGERKKADFSFSSPYTIEALEVEALVPKGAEDFKAVPQPAAFHSDDLGLRYGTSGVGKLEAGSRVQLSLDYIKKDGGLAVTKKSGGKTVAAVGRPSSRMWPYLVAVVGAGALLFFGYWSGTRRRPGLASAQGRPAPPPVRERPSARYCSQCGEPLGQGGRFCQSCGSSVGRQRGTTGTEGER